jgi:tetratricopeptide (TPR) repeat protein
MKYINYFFAIVLAACMLISAVPVSFAATCVADETSFNMGTKYGREQNHDKAIEMLTLFISANKDRQVEPACREASDIILASAYFNRGVSYLQKLDNNRAISDFSEAIRLHPHVPSYYYYRGMAYSGDKQTAPELSRERQISDLAAATKLDPKYGLKALYLLGHDPSTYTVIPESPKEVEDVQKIIDTGLDINLTDDEGRTALMYAAGWGHKEVLKLLLSKGASPNRADNHGTTALIFAIVEGRDETVSLLEPHAVAEKEFRALASYYLRKKNYQKAFSAIDRAIVLDGENPDNWIFQGNIHMAMKNYDAAIASFQKALLLVPNRKEAVYKLSICYGSKAMEAAPEDYALAGNQAAVYLKGGEIEKAVELYSRAFDIVTRSLEKEKNSKKYQSASWYALFLTRFADAGKYAQDGLGINPPANDLRSNLGHALLLQGKKSDALAEYRKYIEQDPKRSVFGLIDSLDKDFSLLILRYPEKKALVEEIESQLYIKN